MKCWACQSKMGIVDSRMLYEGRQRKRKYRCKNCGEETYTLEKIITKDDWHVKRGKKTKV